MVLLTLETRLKCDFCMRNEIYSDPVVQPGDVVMEPANFPEGWRRIELNGKTFELCPSHDRTPTEPPAEV